MELTDKNFAVFESLCEMVDAGFNPSIQELSDVVGLSWPTTRYHLTRLEQAGLISRVPAKNRSIKIIQ